MYIYPSSPHKNSSNTTDKIRSNSWENLTKYYLLTCRIAVNVIVWEIGHGKQDGGQSRAPSRVIWTKGLPRDTVQPMEAALRNSNEIICIHRKLHLQVPVKVFTVSGLSIILAEILNNTEYRNYRHINVHAHLPIVFDCRDVNSILVTSSKHVGNLDHRNNLTWSFEQVFPRFINSSKLSQFVN